jgi:nitrogen fixation NifU-like protein
VSDPLYRPELLRLAADATGAGHLPAPTTTGAAFNPNCGDRVSVELAVTNGQIEAVAHDTRACVLAQASASILGARLAGQSAASIASLRAAIAGMLSGEQPPAEPFDSYAVFDGVADHPARHRCVLLPVDAVLDALAKLEAAEPSRERSER